MENNSQFTIKQQIACVEEEIKMRHKVYAKLVATGKMALSEKERKIATMTAVLNTLTIARRIHLDKSFNQSSEEA